jgi:hypothetical protein
MQLLSETWSVQKRLGWAITHPERTCSSAGDEIGAVPSIQYLSTISIVLNSMKFIISPDKMQVYYGAQSLSCPR